MKAAVLEKIGKPLSIVDINESSIFVDYGQVLVRILSTGICGAQLQEIDGIKGDPSHCPHMLGHEGFGIVEKIGQGVTKVKVGEKVVIHWRKGSGADPVPVVYEGGIKSGPCTSFSELTVVSSNRVTAVPDDLPSDLGALLGCCLSTALSVSENEVRWGQDVLVIGCGGVGLSMILASKIAHGCVDGFDIISDKSDLIKSLGANWKRVFFSNDKFDVILDTSGSEQAFEMAQKLLAPSGKYILIGQPANSIRISSAASLFAGEGQTIQATQGGGFNPDRDLPRYYVLWSSGILSGWENIITHRMPLELINEGIDLMRSGKTGRVMIEMNQ